MALGRWSASHEAADPPDLIRLTEEPLEGAAGQFLVRPQLSSNYNAFWKPAEEGNAIIVFSTGYVGVQIHVTEGGPGTFEGLAETFTDVLPFVPARAAVKLESVTCYD